MVLYTLKMIDQVMVIRYKKMLGTYSNTERDRYDETISQFTISGYVVRTWKRKKERNMLDFLLLIKT